MWYGMGVRWRYLAVVVSARRRRIHGDASSGKKGSSRRRRRRRAPKVLYSIYPESGSRRTTLGE